MKKKCNLSAPSSDLIPQELQFNPLKFRITTGKKILRQLTFEQLISVRKQIERLENITGYLHQKEASQHLPEIEIQKSIVLYEDHESPLIFYSVNGEDCDIQMVSHTYIRKISQTLHSFLEKDDCPNEKLQLDSSTAKTPEYPAINISEERNKKGRSKVFPSAVGISQAITYNSHLQQRRTFYMLLANELCTSWLTSGQLKFLYQKLRQFLAKYN